MPRKGRKQKQAFIGPLMPNQPRPTVRRKSRKKKGANAEAPNLQHTAKIKHIQNVCAITDPFCPKARNARWPDGQGNGSVAYQVRGHVTVPTLANGGNVIFITGGIPYSYLLAASYAAPNYTMAATEGFFGNASLVSNYAQTARIVTAGIHVRGILPSLTAQGYVQISKLTDMPDLSAVFSNSLALGTEIMSHSLAGAPEPLSVILKPIGSSSRAFVPLNTNTTYWNTWDVLKVEIIGGPASTAAVLDIEFVANIEFTLNDSNIFLTQFVPQAAPSNPKAIQHASNVSNSMGTFIKGAADKVEQKVAQSASNLLDSALSAGSSLLSDLFTFL